MSDQHTAFGEQYILLIMVYPQIRVSDLSTTLFDFNSGGVASQTIVEKYSALCETQRTPNIERARWLVIIGYRF
jgi:hypothetical protein